ncbi:MAG: tetratricopeptide repeat protein, partial [Woeseia sp.]|nr:tetratricopeptide repeat protein [Woeseia sp.]
MSPGEPVAEEYQAAVRDIRKLLSQRRADDAARACEALNERGEARTEPVLLLGKARQQQGRFAESLALAEKALTREPAHVGAQLQFAEACIFCGQHDRALQQLASLEQSASNDANLLQHVAEFFAHVGKHQEAHRCYLRAI